MPVDSSLRRGRRAAARLAAAVALLLGVTAGAASAQDRPLPGFRDGTVTVDGTALHYVRGGSGPALVLLHGWPETWWSWHEVMPELARRHTVVAFDLPGLGESGVPSGGFDAATTARRLHRAVASLGLGRVGLLGADLGALIAYPYARDFPADVTRIAVVETPLNGFGLEGVYGVSWHFGFNMTAKPVPENIVNDDRSVAAYLGWLYDGSSRHPDAIPRERYFRDYADPAKRSAGYEYYRAFPANAADNTAHASPALTLPVLAMGAEAVFGPAVAASFRHVATDVREVVAPDTGHFVSLENPRFLAGCAAFFFGGQDGPAACAP